MITFNDGMFEFINKSKIGLEGKKNGFNPP